MRRLAGLFLALVAAMPLAAENSSLRRLTDADDLWGWEAVGRLDLGRDGFCTGTLIATDLVLTAAHCAFDAGGEHFAPGAVVFRAGLRDGHSIADRRVVQIVTPEAFVPRRPISDDFVRTDVALMRLDAPIPVSMADPFAFHTDSQSGGEVSVASYGAGRAEAISRQRSCHLLSRRNGIIAFDCDLTHGSSGSAILARVGPRWRILSVVSGGGTYDGRKVGFGPELPDVVAGLKRQLRSEAPAPAAGVRRLQVGTVRNDTGAKFVRPGGG